MMNVIWIVADTFRRDHIGAYGNPTIRTPSLDGLAAGAVRFDRHYSAGFPTCPPRRTTRRDAGQCPLWDGSLYPRT